MYFKCGVCGKYVDDGCPTDKICLNCIDKGVAQRDLMNYKLFNDLSKVASSHIDSSDIQNKLYWQGYFQAVEDIQKDYIEIRKHLGA